MKLVAYIYFPFSNASIIFFQLIYIFFSVNPHELF